MVDLAVLPAFIGVILLFLIPPGPDMVYMIAVGLAGGRRAALQAILGIGTGMLVYAALVVVGVGEIARAMPLLLTLIKLLGAAYLLWLARGAIRDAREPHVDVELATGRWYLRGATVSLTNPKLILFFLAVLPQFLGDAPEPTLQLAMLGAVNVAAEVLLYGTLGVLAGTLHARVRRRPRATRLLQLGAGAVYALLAVAIVVETLAGPGP